MPKPNWGGAATGAATGAAAGSVVPGIGTAIGAVAGGLLGLFSGGSKKQKVKPTSTQSKGQKELEALINEGLIKGTGPFAELFGEFNQEEFNEGVAKPALKNFEENILPVVQEKFISGNQVLGSGMRRGQLKAANDLQENLSQLLYQAQQQHKQNKLSGINSVLGGGGKVENIVQGATKGSGEGLLQGILPEVAKAVGKGIYDKYSTNTPQPQSPSQENANLSAVG